MLVGDRLGRGHDDRLHGQCDPLRDATYYFIEDLPIRGRRHHWEGPLMNLLPGGCRSGLLSEWPICTVDRIRPAGQTATSTSEREPDRPASVRSYRALRMLEEACGGMSFGSGCEERAPTQIESRGDEPLPLQSDSGALED